MGDVEGTTTSNFGQIRWVQAWIIRIRDSLAEVKEQGIPGPLLAAIFVPHGKGRLAAWHPGEVVQRGTPPQGLATSVGLLDTLVVIPLDDGGLIRPVILAVAEVHGRQRRGNLRGVLGIAIAGLDHENGIIGVLRQRR